MWKAFLRFETLTTELFVKLMFAIVAAGLILGDLYPLARGYWPIGFHDVCPIGLGVVLLVVKLLVLRVSCELTLLLFLSLRKYTGK